MKKESKLDTTNPLLFVNKNASVLPIRNTSSPAGIGNKDIPNVKPGDVKSKPGKPLEKPLSRDKDDSGQSL
jgi:hypothetical protein